MAESKARSTFELFDTVDCSSFIEEKNGMSYLKFPSVWKIVKSHDPKASWDVVEFDKNGRRVDEATPIDVERYPFRVMPGDCGFTMYTVVTIDGVSAEMDLPIIDANNYSIKRNGYSVKTKYGEKFVAPLNSQSVNTSKVRCLVKNIALNFGLGRYVYEGKDYNEECVEPITGEIRYETEKTEEEKAPIPEAVAISLEDALAHIFDSGKKWKGKTVMMLVEAIDTEDNKEKILNMYATRGSEKDKQSCQVVQAAINAGKLSYCNNIKAAC